jgi:hypothetical protein
MLRVLRGLYMNPNGSKPAASSNVYTAILALAFAAILATAVFVALKCLAQYGTIFSIP